jgi:D-alanyl-D-alanine carboxypeptidase
VSYHEPARRARRRALAALVVVSFTLVGVLGYKSSPSPSTNILPVDVVRSERPVAVGEIAPPSSSAAPPIAVRRSEQPSAPPSTPASSIDLRPGEPGGLRHESRGGLGEADGVVPDGTTVFDDELAGVARLDTALLDALRQAATDAADEGVHFVVHSGWRSAEYQDQLLREAISQYGSEEEAARWVATADTSAHVTGNAVDIGHSDATAWLSEHGAEYGLCQIYVNEPWHYELRPDTIRHGCPSMYADPTHDPRMHQ